MSPVANRELTLQEQSSSAVPHAARARGPSSQQSGTKQSPASPRVGGVSSPNRANSTPQTQEVRSMKGGEDLPPLPSQRSRAKSFVASLVSTVRKMLPSSQQSAKKPTTTSPQVVEVPPREPLTRNRVRSAPQKVQSMKDSGDSPPSPSPRSRAKSTVASSSRNPSSSTSAEHSRVSPRRPAMSYAARRTLNSTVRQALPEHFKFRILVVGKSGSGKSSLIKVVFKVDVTAAPERAPGKPDINVEFRPGDNRYLIVHECSGLDSPQDLQTIRDFITHRTDPSRSPSERLHAVWICIPASDAIAGRLGDGVEEILGLRNVPVVVVFTKFDVVVSEVRLDSPGESHERARTRAHTMYEGSCRRLFHKDPRDVPAEIVSESSRFIDLIDNLVVTTDRFITDSRGPSARSSGQGAKQRVGAVPLAWSAALRVNHDIIIQASIEVGRSRYWSDLWFSRDFTDQTLKNCVNIIHLDIIEIWNMNDKRRYLSGDIFKAKMSHLVKDLAGSANATSGSDLTRAGDDYADWVNGVYRGSQENVRCVVGYIVDLTVILDGIFRIAAGDMSPSHAQQVFERHARSRHRDAIHRDIRSFITEAFAIRSFAPQKDLILERTIDLIKQCCVPPSGNS
ncbi:hypothetical protein EDB84DRAFT_1474633 [Lactarius hengduanensis]|nr:hypothetical protein EDB84DRAFT_1474633 [Lactarius hengduanensis]